MATSAESSSEMEDAHSPTIPQSFPPPQHLLSTIPNANIATTTVENAASWIDDAMRQALVYQNTIVETLDSTIDASRARLSQIRDTSIAHTSQTVDSLREIASEYSVYEHMVFAKIKEGVNVAASHPLTSGSLAFGVGIFALKSNSLILPRVQSPMIFEEALLSRADLRVKELRQSLDRLTAESEKLERVATVAEDELIRGRMKLRQAGKQIRDVVQSAYKIENQAAGLKDVLKELPTREASRFRSQISNRASEIKQERKALTKEVNKISNYGIATKTADGGGGEVGLVVVVSSPPSAVEAPSLSGVSLNAESKQKSDSKPVCIPVQVYRTPQALHSVLGPSGSVLHCGVYSDAQ
ncbi:hypothetical protein Bca4012_018310 [Brassica carinata]